VAGSDPRRIVIVVLRSGAGTRIKEDPKPVTGHTAGRAREGYPPKASSARYYRCGVLLRAGSVRSVAHPICEAYMAEPTYEELKAKLAQLEKEVETKKRSGDLIFKVGEKGGVSVYGLGRFPVTLYYEQWNRLLGAADDIRQFMEENKSKLKLKEQG